MAKAVEILRAITLTLAFSVFGFGAIIISYILFPFITFFYKNEKEKLLKYSKIIHISWQFFCKYMRLTGVMDYDNEDFEKLKSIKNSIIIATHPSYIDVVIMLGAIPETTCFVAKRITQNFFMKNIVKTMFLISDDDVDKIVASSKKMLDCDFNILIFPSGKRHKIEEIPHLKKGAAHLAYKLKKDLIPVKIMPDFDFLQRNTSIYELGKKIPHYKIEILDTIKIDDFIKKYDDEITLKKELTDRICDVLFK